MGVQSPPSSARGSGCSPRGSGSRFWGGCFGGPILGGRFWRCRLWGADFRGADFGVPILGGRFWGGDFEGRFWDADLGGRFWGGPGGLTHFRVPVFGPRAPSGSFGEGDQPGDPKTPPKNPHLVPVAVGGFGVPRARSRDRTTPPKGSGFTPGPPPQIGTLRKVTSAPAGAPWRPGGLERQRTLLPYLHRAGKNCTLFTN